MTAKWSDMSVMAMPQRDDPPTPRLRRTGKIEAIKRLEPPSRKRYGGPGALLEYAVMHNDEPEAERLRTELRRVWSRKCVANFARKVRPALQDWEVIC